MCTGHAAGCSGGRTRKTHLRYHRAIVICAATFTRLDEKCIAAWDEVCTLKYYLRQASWRNVRARLDRSSRCAGASSSGRTAVVFGKPPRNYTRTMLSPRSMGSPEHVLRASAIVAALVGGLLAGGGTWVFPVCAAGFELLEQHRKSLALLATPVLLSPMPLTSAVLLWVGTSILVALPTALGAEPPRSQWQRQSQEAQSLLGAGYTRTPLRPAEDDVSIALQGTR